MPQKHDPLASRLRHRITIQEENSAADTGGGSVLAWEDVANIWAEIRPIQNRSASSERVQGGKIEARGFFLITIRYLDGVTPAMRISFGTRIFNIRSVINLEERGEVMEILAEEGVGA